MIKTIPNIKQFKGICEIPSSKSHTQRVLACALLSDQKTIIHNMGNSDDERAVLSILQQANTKISQTHSTIVIDEGDKLFFHQKEINFNESGLASRLFTPILANVSQELVLNGKGSLLNRPMHELEKVLKQLGVEIQTHQSKLPFRIKGPFLPKNIVIDGSLSSQFVSGFIYAFVGNPKTKNEIIEIQNPTSIPYIELSLAVLKEFGIELNFENNKIQFNGPYTFKPAEIFIEGDWSSASFLLVAAALMGEITIKNLRIDSFQADIKVLEALKKFGAQVIWEGNHLKVKKDKNYAFTFDATHCPDLFPPLAVLASFADDISKIKGVSRLYAKESNRALTLQNELGKLGAKIELKDDEMWIHPSGKINSNEVSSCHDHRIAMACTIYAAVQKEEIIIHDAEAINKSFPEFYDLFEGLCIYFF